MSLQANQHYFLMHIVVSKNFFQRNNHYVLVLNVDVWEIFQDFHILTPLAAGSGLTVAATNFTASCNKSWMISPIKRPRRRIQNEDWSFQLKFLISPSFINRSTARHHLSERRTHDAWMHYFLCHTRQLLPTSTMTGNSSLSVTVPPPHPSNSRA